MKLSNRSLYSKSTPLMIVAANIFGFFLFFSIFPPFLSFYVDRYSVEVGINGNVNKQMSVMANRAYGLTLRPSTAIITGKHVNEHPIE